MIPRISATLSRVLSLRIVRMLVVGISVPAADARAQQSDTTLLAPVVVTASRTGASQRTSTAATTVLRGDALRARGITTVSAALREVPGVTIAQTAGRGSQTSLFLRGGEADYVQIMIDGVTVNEPGGAFNLATLALDDVDRIEIVRGPTSVLYGSSAVTGVIQIFTRGATSNSAADVLLRAGGDGLFDVEASAGGGADRRAAWWVGAGQHRSAGVHDLNNDSRNSTLSGRLRLLPFSTAALDLTGRYTDARYDYPTEFDGAALDSNSYTTDRRLTVGANLIAALLPRADLRLGLGLSRAQNITNDPLDNRTVGDPDFASYFASRSLRRTADAQLDLRILPGGTLTLGGEYDWQRLDSGGEDPGTDPLLERWSRGVFAQLGGDAGSRVSYSVGGRLDDNERFGEFESFRASVGVRITASASLRGSIGTAFKEPQFSEITGGGFALPNPSLEPERSRSWEAGIEQRFAGERFAFSATRFDQTFSRMIVYAPIPVTQGYSSQYQNAQSADVSGWEMEGRAVTTEGVTLRASYTLVDGESRATATSPSAPLLRRASHTSAFVLTVPLNDRLLLTADHSHTGPRDDILFLSSPPFSRAVRMPSYHLVGLGTTYRLARRGALDLELMARVDNLMDERYHAVAGFATEGRTASIGVRIDFAR